MKHAFKAGSIGFILFALLISINRAQAATPEVLYSFNDGNDGGYPTCQLLQASDGAYYGTTYYGGANAYGTVFKYSQGKLTTLASFDYNTTGGYPVAGLIQGKDGNFYGTTYEGGAGGWGTIYKMKPNGNITVLASLNGTTMGKYIYAPVMQGADGFFYGVAYQGGANGFGTIFRVKANGNFTVLKSFDNITTGINGYSGLLQLSDGNLYGTAVSGGVNGYGTVFRMKTNGGSFKVLASFDGNMGAYLFASLVLGPGGFLYSVAYEGGTNGVGTIFSISPTTGAVRDLFNFDYDNTGGYPFGQHLVVNGNTLYGTAYEGGTAGGYGTVFSYNVTGVGTFSVLASFDSTTTGSYPEGGVIIGSDGFLYGTTYEGARNGYGDIFRLAK